MDPTTVASATTLLAAVFQALGVHHSAAMVVGGIGSLGMLGSFLDSHFVMPYLPVATAASRGWYRGLYGFLRIAAGNYRNATPTPNAAAVGAQAGVPPAVK